MGEILHSFQAIFQNPLSALVALLFLSVMEIVLGIDNIVFISILSSRLPVDQQPRARRLGLALALVMRIMLLLVLTWILGLTEPLFEMPWLESLLTRLHQKQEVDWLTAEARAHIVEISGRDLILFIGGLFLIWKATHEIHREIEGEHDDGARKAIGFTGVLVQIALMDIIFSLDSVITAAAMTDFLAVMILAVIVAVGVMMIFAESVSGFIHRHPTLKMLALSFLVLIGANLTAEGLGFELPKGYVYFAMAFSVMVELLNMRLRVRKREPQPPA